MLNTLGLSWDHTNGRRLLALLVVLLLAFSLVGAITTQAAADVDATPQSVEMADGTSLIAGGSWSYFTKYTPPGDSGGMSTRGASWS